MSKHHADVTLTRDKVSTHYDKQTLQTLSLAVMVVAVMVAAAIWSNTAVSCMQINAYK